MSANATEERMRRLGLVRAWLESKGWRIKVDHVLTAPIPRYQITGNPRWFSAGALIRHARTLGWSEDG